MKSVIVIKVVMTVLIVLMFVGFHMYTKGNIKETNKQRVGRYPTRTDSVQHTIREYADYKYFSSSFDTSLLVDIYHVTLDSGATTINYQKGGRTFFYTSYPERAKEAMDILDELHIEYVFKRMEEEDDWYVSFDAPIAIALQDKLPK